RHGRYIDAAELLRHGVRDAHAAFSCGDICRHEQLSWAKRSGRLRAVVRTVAPTSRNRAAMAAPIPLRAAGDERASSSELATVAHHRTSSVLIRPFAAKPKR